MGENHEHEKARVEIEIGDGEFTWTSNLTYEDTIKYLEIVKMDAFKQLTKPKGE